MDVDIKQQWSQDRFLRDAVHESAPSLIYCPSLVLSTKLWFEISSTMKCTICLSGSIQRSFKVNLRCHIVSYAAIRSIRTAQAVSLASKQSSVSCVSSVTRSTVDHSLWKPACSCGSWGSMMGLIRPWIIFLSSLNVMHNSEMGL